MAEPIVRDLLLSFVTRIEKLEEEKASIAGDLKEVYAEAKARGFVVKILRKVIALRKLDAVQRAEEEAILESYLQALGMLVGTPLADAAIRREFGEGASLA